jgi:recombination protein RecT
MSNLKSLIERQDVAEKFKQMLGQKAPGFLVSVMNTVNNNPGLKKCEPNSVLMAAATAATLDLPIDQNLGLSYIIPYSVSYKDENGAWKKKDVAQFQIGYKGFKQLAIRSGQFAKIHASDVRDGEIQGYDRLTGELLFKWESDFNIRKTLPVVGYVSYFRLINGFESTYYMEVSEVQEHAKRYSKSFKDGKGIWSDDFDKMAMKTVTKHNLSKNAPLSIEMQTAIKSDQSIVNDTSYEYVDNKRLSAEEIAEEKENDRISQFIETSTDIDTLSMVEYNLKTEDHREQYNNKLKQLSHAGE